MKQYISTTFGLSVLCILSACKKDLTAIATETTTSNLVAQHTWAARPGTGEGGDSTFAPVILGDLKNYVMVFTDSAVDIHLDDVNKGLIGDIAVNGSSADLDAGGRCIYAGTIFTNTSTLDTWSHILDQNTSQSSGSYGNADKIAKLTTDLNSAFRQIDTMHVTPGYSSVSSASLNGLNTQNGIAETLVINITSGMTVKTLINITGDSDDVFVLRWDADSNPANGYQGLVKFQDGGAVVPHGGLKATNFINTAGDISSDGAGHNPATPYPQGPRFNDGTGSLITGGIDFKGGGFFTGYWLTTGDPHSGKTGPLTNAIFTGGWFTTSSEIKSHGTGGVYVTAPVILQ